MREFFTTRKIPNKKQPAYSYLRGPSSIFNFNQIEYVSTASENCLRALINLLDRPNFYTKKELGDSLKLKRGAMRTVFDTFENTDFDIRVHPDTGKIAIFPGEGQKAITRLKALNKEDKKYIELALKRHPNPEQAPYILDKINRLYDFEQLGLRALRRPALDKIDLLEKSKEQKRQVKLFNYKSNSRNIEDRRVECHEVDMESGIIKVYDHDKGLTRHFKLNRIERIELTPTSWQNELKYVDKKVDPFRIADNKVEPIHLLLDLYAFNSLRDSFPKAAEIVENSNQPGYYHLETKVNHNFLGVVPFILSNPGHVEVKSPPQLIEKVRENVRKILANEIEEKE